MKPVIIESKENGPNIITDLINGDIVAVLCRCGASKKKPYCDGSHRDAGFIAPANMIE